MRSRTFIGSAVPLVLMSSVVLVGLHRLHEQKTGLAAARSALERTTLDVQTIYELRSQREHASLHVRPTQDVIARVHQALAEAGLTANRFAELRSESDAALASSSADGTPYRVQSLALSLRGLTVADLGAFLDAWLRANPAWTITRITLAHARTAPDANQNQFDISLILSALYVGE